MKKHGFLMKMLFLVVMATVIALSLFTVASASMFNERIAVDDETLMRATGNYYPAVIAAAYYKDGIITSLETGYVAYFEDGEIKWQWKCVTSESDFFFRVDTAYPDAGYDFCAKIDCTVYSFHDDFTMRDEIRDVYWTGFGEDYVYFFGITDGTLYFWTPYAYVMIGDDDVTDVVASGEYVFYTDNTGSHILNASLIEMCRRDQRFFEYHPLQIAEMGFDIDIWAFYCDMDGWETGAVKTSETFNEHYGIDFSKWGHPKYDMSVEDFCHHVQCSFLRNQYTFDSPIADYSDPVEYDYINFYGHEGRLSIYYANEVEVRTIYWKSYSTADNLFPELRSIVADRGGEFVSCNDDGTEYVYELDGQLIHVGCSDMAGAGKMNYIYVDNLNIMSE